MSTGWSAAVCTLAALAGACTGTRRDPQQPGDRFDEGAGLLARASESLVTGANDDPAEPPRPKRVAYGTYGGTGYGGAPYGGDPYGGASYAHWTAPTWSYARPSRPPHYVITDRGLDSTIEGTVTWPGRLPRELVTPCGPLASVHVGANRGVRDVVVYIEHVTTGRGLASGHARLGGMVAKHGCVLGPTAQIAVPLPTTVAIHGDAQRTRVRITPPGGTGTLFDLQEGGLVTAELLPGVTRIDGEDGKLAAAWVIGIDSPYFSITDDSGRFRIEQLAAGTYDVTFWQAPIPVVNRDGTFGYGAPLVVHRTIRVGANQTAKLSVPLPVL